MKLYKVLEAKGENMKKNYSLFITIFLIFVFTFNALCSASNFARTNKGDILKHLDSSIYYYEKEDYDTSEYYAKRVLEIDPDNNEARVLLAQIGGRAKDDPDNPEDIIEIDNVKTFEYRVGVGDKLAIHVWEEESLNEEVMVRPDGRISMPLAGEVFAKGLTFAELKERIIQQLQEYIKHPVVSIVLKEMGGKKVVVLGEVRYAGVFSLTGHNTVLDAIGKAGGFTEHAVPSSAILVRGGLQNPEGQRLDLMKALKKADMQQNVPLMSGDIIYVPKRFIASWNYVLTQILGPLVQGASTVTSLNGLSK